MTVPDPIRILGSLGRPAIFLGLIACLIALSWVMRRSMAPANEARRSLNQSAKVRGVVDLQLAPDADAATKVIADWGERGRKLAAFTIGLDALYIVVYVAILILGCRMAGDGFAASPWPWMATLGLYLAWAAVVAGGCDAIENWGLIRMLDGEMTPGLQRLTRLCARIKFLLSGLAGVYVIAAMALLRGSFFK